MSGVLKSAALSKSLIKIYSNPPILYYGCTMCADSKNGRGLNIHIIQSHNLHLCQILVLLAKSAQLTRF